MSPFKFQALLLPLFVFCGCGPKSQITVRVVDDDHRPVVNAKVVVMAFNDQMEGNTDERGTFVATLRSATGQLDLAAEKDGFHKVNWVSHYFTSRKNGNWQPWNPTKELQLRRRECPIAMFVKAVQNVVMPVTGRNVGYDLVIGDWVSPYGAGQQCDFLLTLNGSISNRYSFKSELTIVFPNPGDGLKLIRIPNRDDYGLRLPAIAPETGYSNDCHFLFCCTQNQPDGIRDLVSTATEDDNYYFRIRTKQGAENKAASALYGKIYGGIHFEPGLTEVGRPTISFVYYLNPTGSRNTEWDTRSNLCANPGDISGRP